MRSNYFIEEFFAMLLLLLLQQAHSRLLLPNLHTVRSAESSPLIVSIVHAHWRLKQEGYSVNKEHEGVRKIRFACWSLRDAKCLYTAFCRR